MSESTILLLLYLAGLPFAALLIRRANQLSSAAQGNFVRPGSVLTLALWPLAIVILALRILSIWLAPTRTPQETDK